MLVECGYVRVTTSDGAEFTFCPSFGRIASMGSPEELSPQEIVKLYAGLYGPRADREAAFVLSCLCEQEDVSPLIGWFDGDGYNPGEMPVSEQIIIARHLMHHGIVGKAKPAKGDGKYSDKFNAAEYIADARVHLGLSSADAEALSMTEFQMMFEMKFPSKTDGKRDVPTREEYQASLAAIEGRRNG